jgi:hypothetical protein
MKDSVKTYIRIIEDLERLAATSTESQPFDPDMVHEIVELKRELERNHGIVYFDVDDGRGYMHYMHERPFSLEPAIRKCSKCGKTITATTNNHDQDCNQSVSE